MDCDRFDRKLMDLLYDELEELPKAAALRHIDHCQRCRLILMRLRATREAASLPLLELPGDFESRTLSAERLVYRQLPWRKRLQRALTIASGYAMRPQLAMGALLLLMIGSSLVLLRPKPGSHSSVHVTERGVPRATPEAVVVPLEKAGETAPPATAIPRQAAPIPEPRELVAETPSASADPNAERELDLARQKAEDQAYAAAMAAFHAQRHDDAQQQFDAIVDAGGKNAPAAELYAALATEAAEGCGAALPRFDAVSARNGNNDLGHLATFHSATCRVELGQDRRAVHDLQKLLAVPAYRQRARQVLSARNAAPELTIRQVRKEVEALPLPAPTSTSPAGSLAPYPEK